MDTVLRSVSPPPRLLIAENNPLFELIPSALNQNIPGISVDLCRSLDTAHQKLPNIGHYDMMIASVGLAEVGNFFLLQRHRTLHPVMPFIVTAGARNYEIARLAIARGAFDIIVAPLTPSDAVSTVQLACTFHELKKIIALRQKKLNRLRDQQVHHRRGIYVLPTFDNKMTRTDEEKYASRQNTLRAYEHTINALQKSLTLLVNKATQVEQEAVRGTVKRLGVLQNMAREEG